MKRSQLVLFALLAAPVIVAAAYSSASSADTASVNFDDENWVFPVEGGGHTDVSVWGLTAMLENKDFELNKVHVPYAGEFEQTDAFVSFDQVEQSIAEFPADKNAKIVVFFRSGGKSAVSVRELVRLGYTYLYNLDDVSACALVASEHRPLFLGV